MAKKKSHSNKKRKSGGLNPEQVAMKKKVSEKKNLFETIWSKKKFDILGKKAKNQGRRIGLARSLAIEKRKKTLLKEYETSRKSNVFLDKRFGEKDDNLPEEDRALLRFQRERQAQLRKKRKYVLTEGDDDILTHHGEALSTLDDFQDEITDDEGDDMMKLNDSMTKALNFGGGIEQDLSENATVPEENSKPRSKKEIMEEIISKSKFYKAQKAKEKEEDEHLKEKLDKDFGELIQSNGLSSLMRSKETRKSETEDFKDYEKLVKEMVLDSRAHASDRTKTLDEIAEEERARLEALEEKRKKRMLDNELSDDDVEANNEDGDADVMANRKMKMNALSGDDLGDSFFPEEEQEKKGWVDEVLDRVTSESSAEDSEEEAASSELDEDDEESISEGSSMGNWEDSDDGYIDTTEQHGNLDALADATITKREQTSRAELSNKKIERGREKHAISDQLSMEGTGDLPYVINAPNNLNELRSLLDNRPDDQVNEAIWRIRACNAISLSSENRKKMQIFYGVLSQYFAVTASAKPLNLKRLNLFVKPLIEMSFEIPYYAACCARERLVRMHNQLSDDLKDQDKNSGWPCAKNLMLLRLWSLIFPASDFRHAVMTPAVLLMSEYLMRCPVKSGRDIAIGSFLCSMLLLVHKDSRRFCPEALNFLQALLMSALSDKQKAAQKELRCPSFVLKHVCSGPWLHVSSEIRSLPSELDFTKIMDSGENDPFLDSDSFKVAILVSVVETLEGFLKIYEDIASFPEVFGPFKYILLDVVKENKMPASLKAKIISIAQLISEKVAEHEQLRQPLRVRVQKPVPIKQYNPRFEENFVQGRDYDPDRERAQRKKLERQLKKEEKGAARELRKDNYFLQEVKAKERAIALEEREEKYRKAMAFLQEQEHAFKSGQLGKGRKKRR
eukprot:TRINITY_DN32930_c0_g1_i1.p1 TRINITY_DN32930_c0_g1~~TRINITY_DN32930_c0_g1_i1.p1  ORF type:complete len:905 (-),score=254.76 TRINITY_DN32930_c0_g1_i1:497-3211(-)